MSRLYLALIADDQVQDLRSLAELPLVLGASPEADVFLDGEAMTPRHAEIVAAGEGLELRRADGSPPLPLRPGTHLRMGDQTLAFLSLPGEGGGGALLDELAGLVPRLWESADTEAALEELLASLRRVFGAEWACVADLSEPARVRVRSGERPGPPDAPLSRHVLETLRRADEPVLVAPGAEGIASVHQDVSAVIACRVALGHDEDAALYLESRATRRTFSRAESVTLQVLARLGATLLRRARETRALGAERERLGALVRLHSDDAYARERLVGSSAAMATLRQQVREVAEHGVTALVLGESGTGKEVVARAIHAQGPRRAAPFVPVHCMALARDLVESELFGHVRGAFSGATADRPGRFELAQGGTLFLDEFGELSPEVQVKLLRVLEERVVQRVGDARERPVDVHLIAATNADLPAAVAAGSFREDLYYRVSVYVIHVPPLRERLEDLPELAAHLLERLARRHGQEPPELAPAALERLAAHAWPGNVRELSNVLHQALLRSRGGTIDAAAVTLPAGPGAAPASGGGVDLGLALPETYDEARAVWEREFLLRALRAEDGKVAATRRRLGMSSSNLYRRFQALGIDPEQVRKEL